MKFEISDADILAIHEVVESQDIKDRAQFLIKQNLFESAYPGLFSAFIFRVFTLAEENGVLGHSNRKGTCANCGEGRHIPLFKSGPRKGEKNYDKEWYGRVIDFEKSFVSLTNYTPNGICMKCLPAVEAEMKKILEQKTPAFEWAHSIIPCPIKMDKQLKCRGCGETMFESEMGRNLAVFGGSYPSTCPKCSTMDGHRRTGEFRFCMRDE